MKKNSLSVWTFPYKTSYYITHPWKWFKELYWNWRNFWHRGRYGYAYIDVWDFCDWYPRVAAEALRYLRNHGNGYPGIKPWETKEKWDQYLDYMANRLERCANSQDITFGDERNEYQELLDEIMTRRREVILHDDGTVTHTLTLTPEEEDIHKRYWAREEEILTADRNYDKETFKWLAEDLYHIWD